MWYKYKKKDLFMHLQGITGRISPNNLAEKKKKSDESVEHFFNALGKQYNRQATLGSEIKNLEIFKRNLHRTLDQINKPFPNKS